MSKGERRKRIQARRIHFNQDDALGRPMPKGTATSKNWRHKKKKASSLQRVMFRTYKPAHVRFIKVMKYERDLHRRSNRGSFKVIRASVDKIVTSKATDRGMPFATSLDIYYAGRAGEREETKAQRKRRNRKARGVSIR